MATELETRILDFFNEVEAVEHITYTIRDDPNHGNPTGFGIAASTAQNILDEREQNYGGAFSNIDEIFAVSGVGDVTKHNIIYSFEKSSKLWIDGENKITTYANLAVGTEFPSAKMEIALDELNTEDFFCMTRIDTEGEIVRKIVGYRPIKRTVVYGNRVVYVTTMEPIYSTEYIPPTHEKAPIFTVKNNGNIGIGTSNPLNKFHCKVSNNTNFHIATQYGTDVLLRSGNDADTEHKPMWIESSTLHLNAATGGKVGIGTTDPVATLDVRGHINLKDANNAAVINFPRTGSVPGLLIRSTDDPSVYDPDSERMSIWNNGNVGIGTTQPQAKLDVNGSLRADNIAGGQLNSAGNLHIDAHNSGESRAVFINWLQGTGGLVVGSGDHQHYGPVYASIFAVNSSVEAKTDIASCPYGLSEILKLNSVKFHYKGDESKTAHIGLIAEDVAQVIPEMVSRMENGDKGTIGIDYGKLSSVLIEAVKEQQDQIEELKNMVKLLMEKDKSAVL